MPRTMQPDSLPATAGLLFDIFLDSVEHVALTASPMTMGPNAGASFRTLDSGTVYSTYEFERSHAREALEPLRGTRYEASFVEFAESP
jgi:hypothetical protein